MPQIKIEFENSKSNLKPAIISHNALRINPFIIDTEILNKNHILNNKKIKLRNSNKEIDPIILTEIIEQLLLELKKNKKKTILQNFKVLKDKDFNYKKNCGTIVLKFKQYPFILKLSIETPNNFQNSINKNLDSYGIFTLGGTTRFLSGFTRIANLIATQKYLKEPNIDFPKKYFWSPKKKQNLKFYWTQTNKPSRQYILPSIYGIICEEVKAKKTLNSENNYLKNISIAIYNYTNNRLDPHFGNCVKEKNNPKCVIIDTENFRKLLGLKNNLNANSYFDWYLKLIKKALKTKFFRTKQARINDQNYIDNL